jgi:hypothetical protein
MSMRKYITAMMDQHPHMDWEDLLPSMMLSNNCHVHRATGDSPFFLTFAHDLRLPYFDIEKPRMFCDSSYVSDSALGGKGELEGTARQTRGLLQQEVKVQNVHAGGPGYHLLPQPTAGHQSEISHLLKDIHID